LGEEDPDFQRHQWTLERHQAIVVLRRICDYYGDNDWKDNLHLADIIEKHLEKYLEAEDKL
jgi:hypothetical protein